MKDAPHLKQAVRSVLDNFHAFTDSLDRPKLIAILTQAYREAPPESSSLGDLRGQARASQQVFRIWAENGCPDPEPVA